MQTLHFRIRGIAPLLMHNGQLANPLNPIVKSIKELTNKGKKKTDDDLKRIMRLEWEGGMYFDEKVGPYIPGINIEACIRAGATFQRKGMDVVRGLMVLDDKVKLEYKGPRDPEKMYESGFVDVRGVRVNNSTTMRCRPLFSDWACEFDVSIDEEILNAKEIGGFVSTAGRLSGLCDFTPRFGRFELIE